MSDRPQDLTGQIGAPDKKAKPWGCLVWGTVILAAFVGCSISVFSKSPRHNEPTSFDAERQCQEWVKERLKAPATASFSGTTSTGGPSSWTVQGDVDSENSFGAKIRSTWSCTIRADGDTWRGGTQLDG